MVKSKGFGILNNLDLHAPRVFDESELEEPGDVPHGRDDFHAGRLEFLHLGVEVGEREADVIDGRSGARLRGLGLEEDEPRLAKRDAVLAFR